MSPAKAAKPFVRKIRAPQAVDHRNVARRVSMIVVRFMSAASIFVAPALSGRFADGAELRARSDQPMAQQAVAPAKSKDNDQASVIIVEFLGFGGDTPDRDDDPRRSNRSDRQDPSSRVQVLGAGELTNGQRDRLVEERRQQVEDK
jgi:hypothetical protein